jgi:hypothetical protein
LRWARRLLLVVATGRGGGWRSSSGRRRRRGWSRRRRGRQAGLIEPQRFAHERRDELVGRVDVDGRDAQPP